MKMCLFVIHLYFVHSFRFDWLVAKEFLFRFIFVLLFAGEYFRLAFSSCFCLSIRNVTDTGGDEAEREKIS